LAKIILAPAGKKQIGFARTIVVALRILDRYANGFDGNGSAPP